MKSTVSDSVFLLLQCVVVVCFLLASLGLLAGRQTQRSVSGGVCVGRLALNMHSSHLPGTFKYA